MKTSIVRRTKIQLKNYPIEPQKGIYWLNHQKRNAWKILIKELHYTKILKKYLVTVFFDKTYLLFIFPF